MTIPPKKVTSRWTQLVHMMISLSGWLSHTTAASKRSTLDSTKADRSSPFWCFLLSFSLATICSGNRKCENSVASSLLALTSWIHTLICVSTRDLAPEDGNPSTRICQGLPTFPELTMKLLAAMTMTIPSNNSDSLTMILLMDPASAYRVRHNYRLSASLDPKDHFVYYIYIYIYDVSDISIVIMSRKSYPWSAAWARKSSKLRQFRAKTGMACNNGLAKAYHIIQCQWIKKE